MSSRIRLIALTAALGAGFIGLSASTSAFAEALTLQQCSVKYQAAKAGNALNGLTWAGFRAAQCSADATAAPAATPAAVAPAPAPVAPKPTIVVAPAKPTAVAPAPAPSSAVFPTAINPAYSALGAGAQRRKTCDDQYKANKATNGNGGLEWIQKGGGYYSECNKRLKV